MFKFLSSVDPQIAKLIEKEIKRQKENLILIPSENYASPAVLEAQASVLTNKYAEGYPGRRYYRGCKYYDEIEEIARERVKRLFGGEYVNVQPHSGTQANMAVYQAFLKPGEVVLSLNLRAGGHLSHGKEGSFLHKYHRVFFYGVNKTTEVFDYDEIREKAKRVRPRLIIVGASAYPRRIDFSLWREIADEVGAYLLADIAHIAGLVAAGLHPNPVPYADVVTSTTHKTLRGPRGGFVITRKEYGKLIDRAIFPGIQGGPFMHLITAKAVCFKEAEGERFKRYQRAILRNAQSLASTLTGEGFRLVSGGTDNHLMLVDLRSLGITGEKAAKLLEEAGIVVNKNSIPFDPLPPSLTSGIRPGTPAVTTRGMGEEELKLIGKWMGEILHHPEERTRREKIRLQVQKLCEKYPVYKELLAQK